MTQSTILLVEADILVRHPLAQYLRECGYQVLEAIDAAEARALFGARETSIDVAMIDATTPAENAPAENTHTEAAFDLARWIRQNAPEAEIVMVGSVEKAVKEAAGLCEDGPALTKPYHHQAVLDLIRRRLATHKRHQDSEA